MAIVPVVSQWMSINRSGTLLPELGLQLKMHAEYVVNLQDCGSGTAQCLLREFTPKGSVSYITRFLSLSQYWEIILHANIVVLVVLVVAAFALRRPSVPRTEELLHSA